MKVAVISPHLDDAIFSVAEHMLSRPDWEFTIVCPFGGQPTFEPHCSKYLILHDEHQRVCEFAGWDFINGPFLDDAARLDPWSASQGDFFQDWCREVLVGFDQAWWPMGIHHPDHRIVAHYRYSLADAIALTYEELPYRVLYPEGNDQQLQRPPHLQGYDPSHLRTKKELCRMYASQVDDQLERCLFVPERLWGPK